MDRHFLRRRQLLWYFGLGAMGTGLGTAFLQRQNQEQEPTPAPAVIVQEAPVALASPSPTAPPGMALPEFQGIQQWLNSDPLTVAGLRGNVVMVQFWTFSCINCIRTLPYVTRWHQQYAAQGLQIIGIHTPEFAFERDINNIQRALEKYEITYPVPVDNEYETWKAYRNRFWPHLFLADRDGFLRYDHIGEGAYDETEQTIRQLLG